MKTKFLLFTFFAVLNLFAIDNNNVVLNGKILDGEVKTVKIYIKDLIKGEIIQTAVVDVKGMFKFEFNQNEAHDNQIVIGKNWFTFFAEPGDKIQIDYSESNKSANFTGDNCSLNLEIQQLFNERPLVYASPYNTPLIPNSRVDTKTLDPEKHRDEALFYLKKYKSFLEDYHVKKESSQRFKDWSHNALEYYCYENIINTLLIAKYSQNNILPSGIFDFLDTHQVLNDKSIKAAKHCSYLGGFVESYSQVLMSTIPLPENASTLTREKSMELVISHVAKYTDIELRDIVLTRLFYELVRVKENDLIQSILPKFNQHIKNKIYNKFIVFESEKLEKSIKNKSLPKSAYLENLKEDKHLSVLVEEIIKNNKGKVVYIDFWGTWCKPCLDEMPNSKKLQHKYKEEPISFVYLCCLSEENTWKATIADLSLGGQHYLLTKEQYDLFSGAFNISGLPHYALINKEGAVVDKETYGPGEKELVDRIEELLK